MYKTISNKELSQIISEDMVLSECGYSSISVDNKDLYVSASLDMSNLEFNCNMWIGSSEEETELTESQLDTIYYLLVNSDSKESQFSYDEQDHQLTLIHS